MHTLAIRHGRQAGQPRLFVLRRHRGLDEPFSQENGKSTINAASMTGVVTARVRTETVLDRVLEGVLKGVLDWVLDTVRTGGAGGVAGAVGSVR